MLKLSSKIAVFTIFITSFLFIGGGYLSLAADSRIADLQAKLAISIGPEKIQILTQLADHFSNYEIKKAEGYLEQGVALATLANDSLGLANLLYIRGTIQQLKGLNTLAYNDYKRAYSIFRLTNNSVGIAKTGDGLGAIFRYTGDFEKSLTYHLGSLKIFKQISDTSGIISTLNNCGLAYRGLENYTQAFTYYNNALRLAQKTQSNLLATVYISLGSYYWHKQQYDSAFFYYQRTLNIDPKTVGLKERHCAALNNIGNVYRSINQPNKALQYYDSSLIESTANNFINLRAITLKNYGIIYAEKGDVNKATQYLIQSISLGKKSDLKQVVRDNFLLLSNLYQKHGNYKQSLAYHQQYAAIQNSIYTEEQQSKVALLEIDYLIQKKEKDLAILKKNNAEKNLELQKSKSLTIILILIISLLAILFIGVYRLFHLNKTAKENLLSMNDELEKRVKRRTEKLELEIANHKATEVQLLSAKEKAEESDRLKSRFLANLSHEIRTPMNAIVGFTELLAHSDSKEINEQYISVIRQNSKSLLSRISDIIDISQIEANQVKLHISDIDINSLMNELYSTLQSDIENKEIVTLNLSIPNNSISIYSDGIKLRQILLNLVGNAIKFTHQGSITFGYRLTDNQTITFFVDDTGIGIDPIFSKIIFEQFRQVEGDMMIEKGGSGLGLAISKAYVEMLGGTIAHTSEIGKGSSFWFTLPANNKPTIES